MALKTQKYSNRITYWVLVAFIQVQRVRLKILTGRTRPLGHSSPMPDIEGDDYSHVEKKEITSNAIAVSHWNFTATVVNINMVDTPILAVATTLCLCTQSAARQPWRDCVNPINSSLLFSFNTKDLNLNKVMFKQYCQEQRKKKLSCCSKWCYSFVIKQLLAHSCFLELYKKYHRTKNAWYWSSSIWIREISQVTIFISVWYKCVCVCV